MFCITGYSRTVFENKFVHVQEIDEALPVADSGQIRRQAQMMI